MSTGWHSPTKKHLCRRGNVRLTTSALGHHLLHRYSFLDPFPSKQGGWFLKELWCCVGREVKHKTLDSSSG